jgi:hypothetical protein
MRAVAIVDRTADVAVAACAIALSTIWLAGRGPYAPCCVLLNEFIEPQFSKLFNEFFSTMSERRARPNRTEITAEQSQRMPKNAHLDANQSPRRSGLTTITR